MKMNLLYSEVVCLLSPEKHSENDIDFIALFYWDTYILSTVSLWLLQNDERLSFLIPMTDRFKVANLKFLKNAFFVYKFNILLIH